MFSVKTHTSFLVVCFSIAAIANAYDYDPNDFAAEVVEYAQGTEIGRDWLTGKEFNEPNNALGRPTIDTTGDGISLNQNDPFPVLPVYPAFRSFELVTIGNGGHLTVKFNHHVANDANNPYGVDFIIFGNAFHGSGYWWFDNPADTIVFDFTSEPGIVSVSQDGEIWHTFTEGPFADDFAATLGRIYDPNDPNTSIGAWNHWWGRPTNPTLPLDPSLTPQSFDGLSIAQVCEVYGDSAGGTGFDIGLLGLDWVQYVRIENDPFGTTEIDAVADVSCCGDYRHPHPTGDLNTDCRVDFVDFAILAQDWLAGSNWDDLANLADSWLECTWKCP